MLYEQSLNLWLSRFRLFGWITTCQLVLSRFNIPSYPVVTPDYLKPIIPEPRCKRSSHPRSRLTRLHLSRSPRPRSHRPQSRAGCELPKIASSKISSLKTATSKSRCTGSWCMVHLNVWLTHTANRSLSRSAIYGPQFSSRFTTLMFCGAPFSEQELETHENSPLIAEKALVPLTCHRRWLCCD